VNTAEEQPAQIAAAQVTSGSGSGSGGLTQSESVSTIGLMGLEPRSVRPPAPGRKTRVLRAT
jgi:hypothetical protein